MGNQGYEDLADERALRRQRKKRLRMKLHGASLKKTSTRAVLRMVKVEKRRKKA